MSSLAVKDAAKAFGRTLALDGLALAVPDGEFCVLAGPPAAGKSTFLRVLAGLEHLDSGSIEIDGEAVDGLSPRQRDVALVFQKDTLFPRKSVYWNVAFGLKVRRVRRREIGPRVRRIADVLGLTDRLASAVGSLAEIDRRKVAIARAVVREAGICMLDEPLGNLHAELRDAMHETIRVLHREFPTSMLYVTRHGADAMALGERTLLMRAGRVEQEGAPLDLFDRPKTRSVGSFFGRPNMNFLAGALSRGAGDAIRLGNDGPIARLPPNRLPVEAVDGQAVLLGIRPEHMIRAVRASPADGALRHEAEIERLRPAGSRVYATFTLAGSPVVAELMVHDVTRVGQRVPIDINLKRASIFDAATERAL